MGRGRKPAGGQRTRGARPPMMASQIPAPPSTPASGTGTSPSLPRETARQQTRGGRPPAWQATIGGKPTNSLNAFRSFTDPTPRKQSTRGGRPPAWQSTIGGTPSDRSIPDTTPRKQSTRGGRPPAFGSTIGGRGGREFLKQFFRSGRR